MGGLSPQSFAPGNKPLAHACGSVAHAGTAWAEAAQPRVFGKRPGSLNLAAQTQTRLLTALKALERFGKS